GRAVLHCVSARDLAHFKVDLYRLRISKLTLDGRRVKFQQDKRGILIRLVEAIPAGAQFTVEVQYSGRPRAVPSKVLGPTGWEELADGVIVAAQPHGAPSWFPCNDRPGDKASYRISISAPAGYRVVSNGRLVSTRRHAGSTTWVYDQPEPMATYLATVQIGRYTVVDVDAVVRLHAVLPGSLLARYEDAFGGQPAMLAFFSRVFGAYPFENYTVVITQDDLEIPLESQGLSTFGANYLTSDWESERLIAHEMAHQWFGNSLTLADWSDIWLHEGFACYSEWLWSEESGGVKAHQHAVTHWNRLAALSQDLILADPGPELMFDDRVYKRGALTLHAVRLQVGDETFFSLLRGWAGTYAYGTVTTGMFVAFAQAQTGVPLGTLFNAWLNKPALPDLPPGH
ncbi:MAG: M1 family metallopeptidase, partial [Allobranchiibius sp.]